MLEVFLIKKKLFYTILSATKQFSESSSKKEEMLENGFGCYKKKRYGGSLLSKPISYMGDAYWACHTARVRF